MIYGVPFCWILLFQVWCLLHLILLGRDRISIRSFTRLQTERSFQRKNGKISQRNQHGWLWLSGHPLPNSLIGWSRMPIEWKFFQMKVRMWQLVVGQTLQLRLMYRVAIDLGFTDGRGESKIMSGNSIYCRLTHHSPLIEVNR